MQRLLMREHHTLPETPRALRSKLYALAKMEVAMTSSEKGDIDLGSVENLDEGLSEEEKAEIVSGRIIVLFSSPDFYLLLSRHSVPRSRYS